MAILRLWLGGKRAGGKSMTDEERAESSRRYWDTVKKVLNGLAWDEYEEMIREIGGES
jgi:hypothetical protein